MQSPLGPVEVSQAVTCRPCAPPPGNPARPASRRDRTRTGLWPCPERIPSGRSRRPGRAAPAGSPGGSCSRSRPWAGSPGRSPGPGARRLGSAVAQSGAGSVCGESGSIVGDGAREFGRPVWSGDPGMADPRSGRPGLCWGLTRVGPHMYLGPRLRVRLAGASVQTPAPPRRSTAGSPGCTALPAGDLTSQTTHRPSH